MSLIESLNWRYAVKKFDAEKKVSAENIDTIKEAVQLAATSYGLQLFKVLVVEDAETREKLKAASWDQGQITDASHLFVFCSYASVEEGHIDAYVKRKADSVGMKTEELKGYSDFIKGSLLGRPQEDLAIWTAKQTYIALGNLLAACAELKVDSCPMEGFDPAQYNEILGLSEKGLNAAVVATVGYRSAEDQNQHAPKVRKPVEELFETI